MTGLKLQKMLPKDFQERIKNILPPEEWEAFFECCTEPLPKTIRIAKNAALPKNWDLKPVAGIPEAAFITRPDQQEVALGKTLPHFSGQIYIATLSSLLPITILDPQPEEKILDMCAAPGSKTTFISERMDNTGVLVANELSSSRSKKLTANIDRMGCINTVVTQSDGLFMNKFFNQEFDRILLDAPCSSEGYGRKDAKFFKNQWKESKIFAAAKIQKKLIESAFKMLRPDGVMIYSTCTSAPEENEEVVQHLVDLFPEEVEILNIDLGEVPHSDGIAGFEFSQHVKRLWPHKRRGNGELGRGNGEWDSECFFLARITKKSPLKKQNPVKKHLRGLDMLGKNKCAEVFTRLHKKFGFPKDLFAKKTILDREGELFLASKLAGLFAMRNLHRKVGLRLLDKDGNLESAFALAFGKHANKNIVQLKADQKDRWLAGYDIEFPTPLAFENSTEVIVMFEDYCLGTGKILKDGKKLKNKLSRDLL